MKKTKKTATKQLPKKRKPKKSSKKIITKNLSDTAEDQLITFILLCDNPGYRMKSYGPLSLISFNGKKLIDIQIEAIKKSFKKFEIIICLGFDSDKICKYIRSKYCKYPIRIIENQIFNSSNSSESARLCINNTMNDKVIICDGNLMINDKSLKLLDLEKNCVLVEAVESENFEIGINIDNSNAQYFCFGAFKPWSEIIYLKDREIIESFRKNLQTVNNKTKFLFEILNDLIKQKYTIKCIDNKYEFKKINNIKTYHLMKEEL